MGIRVLYCGDTELETVTVTKGFDYYQFSYALDDSAHLRAALDTDPSITYVHLPVDQVHPEFPVDPAGLSVYDVVILSDVGFNNLSLTPGFRPPHRVPMSPNRVAAIYEYVHGGGGFMMIGGWMSFSGIYGKASFGGSRIEELLPVVCQRGIDDRIEVVEGFTFRPSVAHPITDGLPWDEPFTLLGYNRVAARPDATVIASHGLDPVLAVRSVGSGRTAIFASDVAPHWAGTFVKWRGYGEFWTRMVKWLAGAL
jgi:uncharacterized membrane protein